MRHRWRLIFLAAMMTVVAAPVFGQKRAVTAKEQPKAAVDSDGVHYVVFGQNDEIYCAASKDGGKSFSDPVKVGEVENLKLGRRRGPQIAVTANSVVVTAIGRGGDILCRRSEDGGKTWSDGGTVNDVSGSAREGLHAICAGPNEDVVAVWLDLRTKGTKLFASRSADGGKSWSENVLVYESPDGSICECCQPAITAGPEGTYYCMWRNSLGGNRDMWMAVAEKDFSFGEARKLGTGSWPLRACPMDGGSIAVDQDGRTATVWRRRNKVYQCVPGGSEEHLGNGQQPQMVAAGNSFFTVWEQKGKIMYNGPGGDGTRSLGNGKFPSLAAGPTGSKSPVIVVWEQRGEIGTAILPLPDKE